MQKYFLTISKKWHINKYSLSKPKKKKKFRLLFDVAFAHPSLFKRLTKKANLAHARHTYNISPQAEDKDIYQLAVKENRFVVTINYEDFKKLVKKDKAGIIGIPPYLSNEQIDKILTDFISEKDPEDYKGKAIKI